MELEKPLNTFHSRRLQRDMRQIVALSFHRNLLLMFVAVFYLCACTAPTPEPTPLPTPSLSEAQTRGQQLFGSLPGNCATCHSLQPKVQLLGPSLAGVATRAANRIEGLTAQQYIEMSIIKPDAYIVESYNNIMPPNLGKQLSSEQLSDIVAFLLTLE